MSLQLAVPSLTRRRISLTPLIDVVFILLVFFMLETTFLTEAEIAVAAESQGGAPGAQQRRAYVAVGEAVRDAGGFGALDRFEQLGWRQYLVVHGHRQCSRYEPRTPFWCDGHLYDE